VAIKLLRRGGVMDRRKAVLVFGFWALLLLVAMFGVASISAKETAGWPMFQHDPEHTGYTPESIFLPLTLAWKYETDYGYFVGSPIVADGVLYVKDDGGILHALDAKNGALMWEKNVGGGGESTPVIAEGTIYVTGNELYAFDAKTGDLKWTYSEAGFVRTSSPTVVHGIVYFADSYNAYAVNASTGTLKWKTETAQFQMDYPYPSPAVSNGMLYVGQGDGKLYAINISTGALQWKFTTYEALKGSPMVYKRIVYFAGTDGFFYALDADHGTLKWKSSMSRWVDSSPAAYKDVIYISASEQGILYAFDAETGAVRWSKNLFYYTWGSVVIASDRLYIGPFVIDAKNGNTLFEADVEENIDSSAAVANDMVFMVTSRSTSRPRHYGVIYALKGTSDVSAPSTSHNYDGLWHNADFTITLTASDDISGVVETHYKINNGPVRNVSTHGQPRITIESANNTLEYWSVDNAGNEELPHKILTGIKLDKTTPTANAGLDQTVNEDTQVTFDGSASTDENSIASYTWTFTDITPQTLSGKNPTYTFVTPGTYIVTLKVTDAAGNWATDTTVITILDVTKPVANAGEDRTVNVGTTVTFDAGGSSDNVGIVSYEWDFGDGTTGTGKTTTHIYANTGTYTVTLTAKDAAGNTATHTIAVTVEAPPAEVFPMWIVGAAVATIAIATAAIAVFWRRRKQPPTEG
jgi:outer membrane protein assembly factor BamB/plastocyanin